MRSPQRKHFFAELWRVGGQWHNKHDGEKLSRNHFFNPKMSKPHSLNSGAISAESWHGPTGKCLQKIRILYVLRGVWDMPRKAQQRWGAAWFNGQSQRRCCSQFPADAGRRCQEVWRLLAGVWNSPGSLPNHNCYCFGFRDDVKNAIWDECFGLHIERVKIGYSYSCALRVAMRAPTEAHTHCLVRRVDSYISHHMMIIFTVIQVYLHYVYNICMYISRMPPTFKPLPHLYGTVPRIVSDSKAW